MNARQIVTFALGPIGGAALGFVTLPVITWFYTPEDVGRIAILQVAISFSILLFSLGLDQAYVREYHEIENKPALLKLTLLPGFIILAVVLMSFLLKPVLISGLLFEINDASLSRLVSVCILSAFISRFLSLVLRMQERGLAYSMSQLLPKLIFLSVIAIYVLCGFGSDFFYLALARTFSIVFVFFIFVWNTRLEWLSSLKQCFDREKFIELLRYGFPLIFGGVAFWGLTATDKIVLRSLSTFEELGVYSVSVSFAGAAIILRSVFSTVWAPTVYKWASQGIERKKVQQVSEYVLFCVLVLFCLAGTFSWLIDFILPEQYSEVKYIMVPCLGYPLLYTLSETTVVGITISKKTVYAMAASVIAFIFNALGNLLLIPRFGAAGAAVSTSVAFWLFFFLRTEFSIRLWGAIPRKDLYSFTLIVLCMSLVTAIYGKVIGGVVHIIWLVMLLFVLLRYAKQLCTVVVWVKGWRSNVFGAR